MCSWLKSVGVNLLFSSEVWFLLAVVNIYDKKLIAVGQVMAWKKASSEPLVTICYGSDGLCVQVVSGMCAACAMTQAAVSYVFQNHGFNFAEVQTVLSRCVWKNLASDLFSIHVRSNI